MSDYDDEKEREAYFNQLAEEAREQDHIQMTYEQEIHYLKSRLSEAQSLVKDLSNELMYYGSDSTYVSMTDGYRSFAKIEDSDTERIFNGDHTVAKGGKKARDFLKNNLPRITKVIKND